MDSSDPLVSFYIILVSIIASAFFSGSEIAFVSANRLKIELDKKQGYFSAKLLTIFYQRPAHFIGAMLVGNNIALVVYGVEMGNVLTPFFSTLLHLSTDGIANLLLQTLISTFIILLTAEFLPKALFSTNPNGLLAFLSVPLGLCYILLWIPMIITVGISELLLKWVFRVDTQTQDKALGRVDLDHYIKEVITGSNTQDTIDHGIQIFQNALDFGKVKARDCLVPRNEIVAVDFNTPIEELAAKFIETKLSKILVYRDSIDNIIGYTHSFELFKKPEGIKNILLPLFIVPESANVNDVLERFITLKRGVALVVDEFGGTSGMLTIEDVIEEIFGEIEDEHDDDDLMAIKTSNYEYLFSARMEIDTINERFSLELPIGDDFDTLGGLVLNFLGEIPAPKTKVNLERYLLTIEEVSDNKIELIKVEKKPQD
jgi:putative hemolysin